MTAPGRVGSAKGRSEGAPSAPGRGEKTPLAPSRSEALAHGVHSAAVILNILARRHDPGPAVTILTPDALRLRHAPIADCARYDRLRRAG